MAPAMANLLANVDAAGAWLLHNSWQASLLAAMIFTLQRLFRNQLSPKWASALWLLLLVKLLLPVMPDSRFSIFNYLTFERLRIFGEKEIAAEGLPRAAMPGHGITDFQGTAVSMAAPPLSPLNLLQRHAAAVLCGLWLLGVLLLCMRALLLNVRLLRRARKLRPLIEPRLLNLLEDCKSELQVYLPINIITDENAQSPALLGHLRPRLLLPQRMLDALNENELRHVFLHELAHIKRKDVFVSWLITFTQIIYWFNPVLWLAFNRMRSDLEIACDDLALSTSPPRERKAYGFTIIKVLELATKLNPIPGTVGILEDRNYMKRRIRRISQATPGRFAAPLAAGLALLASCTLLTTARTSEATSDILRRFQTAYEQQDLTRLLDLYDDAAALIEVDHTGAPLSAIYKENLAQYYRANFVYSAKFHYDNVRVAGDTVSFHGAFRSNKFEVVGLYEMEGEGTFVLQNGKIVTATWQEAPSLKKRRMEVFDDFVKWLKTERPAAYAEVFPREMFMLHQASSNERLQELFFEWVAHNAGARQQKGIDMNHLPEVKRLTLDRDLAAVCKEFFGSYAEAPKYITEVQTHLEANRIPFRQYHVLGVYFDDPNTPKPGGHRSLQGVVVEQEVEVSPPYFIYRMKQGDEYLYTKVSGEPAEVIPAGYMALFNYMGLKKIQAGSTGGHQVVTMEDGKVAFEIYLKIDD